MTFKFRGNVSALLMVSCAVFLNCLIDDVYALNHATKQIGARNRVWPRGITGDPNSSIAILDTGIDGRHKGFGNGFEQNGDWTRKIIYWYDEFGGKTGIPNDNFTSLGAGHGTHASGIAASSGFARIDDEGRVVNTNAYQTSLSGEYADQTAMYVDKIGTIRIEFAFGSDRGNVEQLQLRFGNKELFYEGALGVGRKVSGSLKTVAAIADLRGTAKLQTLKSDELSKISWNVLEYQIKDSSQFGTYQVVTRRNIPAGNGLGKAMYFQYIAHWPTKIDREGNDIGDRLPYYLGVAPESKLFIVQATSAYPLMDSLDRIAPAFEDYHVVVANISAASSSFKESYFDRLLEQGITTVAAVGNEGPGSSVGAPARFGSVVGVGGLTPADTIPWYNNVGDELEILAPGGSNFTGGGIISVHSGNGNFLSAWGFDVASNDGLGMQGSSMATATAAGGFALVYQALGGWDGYVSNENYSLNGRLLSRKDKANHVRQIVFMTATELNTKRELYVKNASKEGPIPQTAFILNRGYDIAQDPEKQKYGKDPYEGYGRINIDAAVDAILLGIKPGEKVFANLVSSAAAWTSTELDGNGLYQGIFVREKTQLPKALARYFVVSEDDVNLADSQAKYLRFDLNVPSNADFDLYVYCPDWGTNGAPLLCAKSTNTDSGVSESISFQPKVSGTYYVVVKIISGEGRAELVFRK